jgi:DNA polymerase, archaea type
MTAREAKPEWLHGWDFTPGIVGVHAESSGGVCIWRRVAGNLVLERDRFRPWVYAQHLEHVGDGNAGIRIEHLEGSGFYPYLVTSNDWRTLKDTLLEGARRAGRTVDSLNDLPEYHSVGITEQYLMATGRTYFRDLEYRDLKRMQFDLETTGFRGESS